MAKKAAYKPDVEVEDALPTGDDDLGSDGELESDELDDGEPRALKGTAQIEAEVEKVESEFSKRNKAEANRFQDATDSEYWLTLVFQTRAQKEHFIAELGWADLGDKYIDGIEVARRSDIVIERIKEARKSRAFSPRLKALAHDD